MAQTFVSMPFLVVALEGAVRTAGRGFETVAATLGARPTTVCWRVTLPLPARPGVGRGAVVRAVAGRVRRHADVRRRLQGVTRTLPLEIYLQRESDADAAVALSILLVAVAVAGARPRARRLGGRCGSPVRPVRARVDRRAGPRRRVQRARGRGRGRARSQRRRQVDRTDVVTGLVRPDSGLVRLGDRVLTDTGRPG